MNRRSMLWLRAGVLVLAGAVAALLVACSKEAPGGHAGGAAAGPVASLDEAGFDAQVAQGVVLVDFWAPWCGPCRMQGPIVEEVAAKLQGRAKVAKLDIDTAPKVAERLGIQSIPTLIVFKDGKPAQQFVGVTEAGTLVAAVESALGAR